MRNLILLGLCLLASGTLARLYADSERHPELTAVPGVDPIPAPAPAMTIEQVEAFFSGQKKGTPVLLTLDKGKVINGLFSSYDDYYETVWIIPRSSEKGVFNQKGYKLSGVRNVALWDARVAPSEGFSAFTKTSSSSKTAAPFKEEHSDDYYLLKNDGN